MTFVARVLGVLTVALSLALMAVSVYAAKTQAQEPVDTPAGEQPEATRVVGPGSSLWAELGDEATAPFIQEAIKIVWERSVLQDGLVPATRAGGTPTPEFEINYAAPIDAAPVSRPSGRGDLSPGPRVWHEVPSIRPGAAPVGAGGIEIPPDQLVAMQRVGAMTGIPWQILAGIAKVESGFGANMSTSYAGAIGYGQFLPEMWAVFGNGGDPYDYNDVIPAMARYLLAAGAPDDIPNAIYAYNHDWGYVANVLSYAAAYTLPASANGALTWPAVGPISTYYGPNHRGIDIDQTMRVGAPVLAAHDGIVLFAGGDPCCSYGYYVILVSPSGLQTLYAHFSRIAVSVGETVRQGQALGIVGSTGLSTGTHVHFEVIRDGARVNPLDYLGN